MIVHTLLNLHLVLVQMLLEYYKLLCCSHFKKAFGKAPQKTEEINLGVVKSITTHSAASLEELTFKFSEAEGA